MHIFGSLGENNQLVMSPRSCIARGLQITLRPTVSYRISYGFDAKDFVEVAKLVYVEVGTTERGVADKQASASEVARITGLTRREVARLRKIGGCHAVDVNEQMDFEVLMLDLVGEDDSVDARRQVRYFSSSESLH